MLPFPKLNADGSPSRQVGLDGKPFWLPGPRDIERLKTTCPTGILPGRIFASLATMILAGVMAMFPQGVRWSDVVAAALEAGWNRAMLDYAMKVATTAEWLIGPQIVDGVELVEHGPKFPHEMFGALVEAVLPELPRQ